MKINVPTGDQLRILQKNLGKTQKEMADFCGYASQQHWAKLLNNDRKMSESIYFMLCAKLTLSDEALNQIEMKMKEIEG